MARIRSIKPELPTDKRLASCSLQARYTFVLLISQADDYGLLMAEPRQLIGQLYPHDPTISENSLLFWVGELVECGRVRWRETTDGAKVLEIVNWTKHQQVKNPGKPTLLNKLTAFVPQSSVDPPESLPQDSVDSQKMSSAERERERDRERDLSAPNSAEETPGRLNGAWTRQAVELATAVAYPYEPGRFLRILKPFVRRDGAEKALAHFQGFLKVGRSFDDKGTYLDPPGPSTMLRPERFRDTYDDWKPSTINAA